MIRQSVVAGRFYEARPAALSAWIDAAFEKQAERNASVKKASGCGFSGTAVGVVSPHAGYVYSGETAVCAIDALLFADTYILIGPNHTGLGKPVSISTADWQTPFGVVRFDPELMDRFAGSAAVADASAHLYEHSLEVQLPILQKKFERAGRKADFRLFPICMGWQDPQTAQEIGLILRRILREEAQKPFPKKIAIVASSDFSHYLPAGQAERVDRLLIDKIEANDFSGFYDRIDETSATVCGFGPIAALMAAVGGTCSARLLAYTNSGRVSGDSDAVVGYAAIAFIPDAV